MLVCPSVEESTHTVVGCGLFATGLAQVLLGGAMCGHRSKVWWPFKSGSCDTVGSWSLVLVMQHSVAVRVTCPVAVINVTSTKITPWVPAAPLPVGVTHCKL